jgi:hypothetical protein
MALVGEEEGCTAVDFMVSRIVQRPAALYLEHPMRAALQVAA